MRITNIVFPVLFVSCTFSASNEPYGGNKALDIPPNAIITAMEDAPGVSRVSVNDVSGNLTQSGIVKDGNREGNWVEYHPNGIVKSTTPYVNGKIEGLRMELSNNGQLEKYMEYHNDQLHGSYKELRYSNTKEERSYLNGKLEGTVKIYYDNGKIMEEGLYKNGTRDGVSKWYDQEGNITIEYDYKNGELVKK